MRPFHDSKKIREYVIKTVRDAHNYPFGLKIFWGAAARFPRRLGELAVQTKHATAGARQAEINRAKQDLSVGVIESYDRHNGQGE